MIRHYNPNLTGFSLGEHGAEICFGAFRMEGREGETRASEVDVDDLLFDFSLTRFYLSSTFTGALCPVGPIGWNPSQDQLNAALSGSLAVNLPHQARGASRSSNPSFSHIRKLICALTESARLPRPTSLEDGSGT